MAAHALFVHFALRPRSRVSRPRRLRRGGLRAGFEPRPPRLDLVAASRALNLAALDVRQRDDRQSSSLMVGLYALYIGKQPDCTQMTLAETYGPAPKWFDLIQNPVLFSANPHPGSYSCVALRMSDVLTATSATSFGSCVAGVAYTSDIHGSGQTDWMEHDGRRHRRARLGRRARRRSGHPRHDDESGRRRGAGVQCTSGGPFGAKLVVPSKTTLYWDGTGSVTSSAAGCGIEKGKPRFD